MSPRSDPFFSKEESRRPGLPAVFLNFFWIPSFCLRWAPFLSYPRISGRHLADLPLISRLLFWMSPIWLVRAGYSFSPPLFHPAYVCGTVCLPSVRNILSLVSSLPPRTSPSFPALLRFWVRSSLFFCRQSLLLSSHFPSFFQESSLRSNNTLPKIGLRYISGLL